MISIRVRGTVRVRARAEVRVSVRVRVRVRVRVMVRVQSGVTRYPHKGSLIRREVSDSRGMRPIQAIGDKVIPAMLHVLHTPTSAYAGLGCSVDIAIGFGLRGRDQSMGLRLRDLELGIREYGLGNTL